MNLSDIIAFLSTAPATPLTPESWSGLTGHGVIFRPGFKAGVFAPAPSSLKIWEAVDEANPARVYPALASSISVDPRVLDILATELTFGGLAKVLRFHA